MHADALDLIAQHLNVAAAAKARCVNSKWKMAVDSTDVEPVGSAMLQKDWGAFKLQEAACWTPSQQAALLTHLDWQEDITTSMRVTLVNWLLVVQCSSIMLSDRVLHLTLQIIDHYLCVAQVPTCTSLMYRGRFLKYSQ